MIGKSAILFAVVCLAVSRAQSCECSAFANGAVMAPVNEGPQTPPLPVLQAPSITLPTFEAPLVALPSPPVPEPRVISHKCICTKTIVKPQIIQREVKVPKISRYLKRSYTPVIENLAYRSKPVHTCMRGNAYYASRVC